MPSIVTPCRPVNSRTQRLSPLGLESVRITAGPWHEWQRDNRTVSLPHSFGWMESEGTVDNLRSRASYRGLLFTDSDFYKAIEAGFWELGRSGDTQCDELAGQLRDYAKVVEAALDPDGYINSWVQSGHAERYESLIDGHELYCMGHLLQAAVAAHRGCGDDRMLQIATRVADHLVATFGTGRRHDSDGHPEVETALVELYRETGKVAYLELADQFITDRGHHLIGDGGFDALYYQDSVPYREQTDVVGHAVRALYLIAGALDVYSETSDPQLLAASRAQFDAMCAGKLYLTGAVGSRFEGEAFGDAFELPPDLIYGETCAAIAALQVAWRLLLITGEGRYADLIERVLVNVFAASTNLSRDGFFYVNPLQRRIARHAVEAGEKNLRCDAPGTRPGWYDCACCPPNIMRTVASLGAYLVTANSGRVEIHQYLPMQIGASEAGLALTVATDYPESGRVEVVVDAAPQSSRALSLRIPGWSERVTLSVNDEPIPMSVENGYVTVERVFAPGDRIRLEIPVLPRLTVAHPAADAIRGQVAIERGPVVYCLESPDLPGIKLDRVELDPSAPLTIGEPITIGNRVVRPVLATGIERSDEQWGSDLYRSVNQVPEPDGRPITLTAIPYALWANRGPSTMRVWIPAT